ncbi:hypothetical protein GFV14_00670 [Candidatus Hartigia pinicola]|nr:hypothetical protein GFV14_00670 [Candidatus Hartigia pinicola]
MNTAYSIYYNIVKFLSYQRLDIVVNTQSHPIILQLQEQYYKQKIL